MSYHLPIILGQDASERVVMIHLVNKKAGGPIINDPSQYHDISSKIGNNGSKNQDKKEVNRVVIISGNSRSPIFRIPKDVNLIMRDGSVVPGKEVDFHTLHDIESQHADIKHRKSVREKIEKEKMKLEEIPVLNEKEAKKHGELVNKLSDLDNEIQEAEEKNEEMLNGLTGKEVFKVEVDGKLLKLKDTKDYFEYYTNIDNDSVFDHDVDFTFISDYGNEDSVSTKGVLRIVRPGNDNDVMKINVDLGSDATQVGYFWGANGLRPRNVDLISAIKAMYKNRAYASLTPPESGEPLFTQEERNSSIFYKTGNITFHKYDPSTRKGGYLEKPITDDDTFINYLNVSAAGKNMTGNSALSTTTWDMEKPFEKKLINLKMLFSYNDTVGGQVAGVQYVSLLDNPVEAREVRNLEHLLPVMRSIYNQIIKASINRISQRCRFFSVLLLVPNIYVQQNIDSLLHELNKLNDLSSDVRYDFRAISESDASFVGLKKMPTTGIHGTALGNIVKGRRNPEDRDTFLIIDAGKGTTDYSLLYYNEANGANNSTIPLKRHGIVGAGGSIDYVFARVFARQLYDHLGDYGITDTTVTVDVFIHNFMTMVKSLPTVYQDRMMRLVELLKQKYSKGKQGRYQTAMVYECFKGDDAESIVSQLANDTVNYSVISSNAKGWESVTNWNWNEKYIPTTQIDDDEVTWVCETIANTVLKDAFNNIQDELILNIDFVIFTGRSFLFAPLKKAFEKTIKSKAIEHLMALENTTPSKAAESLARIREWYYKFRLRKLKLENPNCDMKTVSVYFMTHNLGMNCNSDLCCMDMLNVIDENAHGIFNKNQFWEGFRTIEGVKHYYIGCPDQAFAPSLDEQFVQRNNPQGDELKLINMTLFPVAYVPVKIDVLPSI